MSSTGAPIATPGTPAQDPLRRYFLEFGTEANAYFHFQPDLDYFVLPEVGFVSYHLQKWLGKQVPMVFVKPLCADADLGVLLAAFLDAHGPGAIFLGMDQAAAAVLGRLGFSVNEFGAEFTLPVQEFQVRGGTMKYLRTVLHAGAKGVEVKELLPSETPVAELQRISAAWLLSRRVRGRELRFLTRPPEFGPAWGVRRFYCFKEGRLVGFVFFDPSFRAGRCIGYCANILRQEPGLKPPGILDFAILTALRTFKAEGIERLSLGIAPLHDLREHPGEDRLLRFCGQRLYHWGGWLYNFRELAFHKTRYRAEPRKLYFCKRGPGLLATVAMGLRATQLLLS